MREIAPFGVRMPPELKARLQTEAKANGRSLNTEVVARLWASLQDKGSQMVRQPFPPAYISNELSALEQQMLTEFRKLAPEKQQALLALFK